MTALNGPSYAGPQLGALVNTKSEVETAQVVTPSGMKPVVVQPGDNLSQIAADNNIPLAELLAANPQFSLDPASNPNTRSADLIYPGEVVFAPTAEAKATDAAGAKYDAATQASEQPSANRGEWEAKSKDVTDTKNDFKAAVQAEIDAGMSYSGNSREDYGNEAVALGEQIAQRYEAQGKPELAAAAREAAQERSTAINNEV